MKPDSTKYYTLDEAALLKAGINPFFCKKRVSCAVEKQLEGYKVAEAYLFKFREAVDNDELEYKTDMLVVKNDVRAIEKGLPRGIQVKRTGCLISEEDVINWPTLDDDLKKFQPATKAPALEDENIPPKTKKAYEGVIAAQTLLIKRYASGQPLPKRFNKQLRDDAKSILHKNGDINARALMELLQEVYPATPTSTEKIIAKTWKQALSED